MVPPHKRAAEGCRRQRQAGLKTLNWTKLSPYVPPHYARGVVAPFCSAIQGFKTQAYEPGAHTPATPREPEMERVHQQEELERKRASSQRRKHTIRSINVIFNTTLVNRLVLKIPGQVPCRSFGSFAASLDRDTDPERGADILALRAVRGLVAVRIRPPMV